MRMVSARPPQSLAPPPPRSGWTGYVGIGLSTLAMLAALVSVFNAAGEPLIILVGGLGFVGGGITAGLWTFAVIKGDSSASWSNSTYASGTSSGRSDGGMAWGDMPWTPPPPPQPPSTLYSSEQLQQAAQRTVEPAEVEANPLRNDPLYALDPVPAGMRCFILPKEGETLARCQDSYALNGARYRFAVTDGVSNSFVPRPWARLVAQGFATDAGHISSAEAFAAWIHQAAQTWRNWMRERWVPAINAQRARRGDRPDDWRSQIEQKGAETTLIGCALYTNKHDGTLQAGIWSVGDAECFIARPSEQGWSLVKSFPNSSTDQFDAFPLTLSTVDQPERVTRTWDGIRYEMVTITPDDCVVLTSDTLAKWVLAHPGERISRLLALDTSAAFTELVQAERDSGDMEDDDMTMLVIPIKASSRSARGQTQAGARP